MSDEFHHPYNFIPVTGKINNESTAKIPYDNIYNGKSHIRHDLWQAGTHSGRLIARLRLETPTIVGGQHEKVEENGLTYVKHYQRDGKIAIPANSLRGMIGSVAETLSQSALRILENKQYSVRKPVEQGLSAIGLLKSSSTSESGLAILPLTIPINLTDLWLKVFGKSTPVKYRLVAPVHGYQHDRLANTVSKIPGSYLDQHPDLPSFHEHDNPAYFYVKLNKYAENQSLEDMQRKLLLGQEIDENSILTADEYKKLYKNMSALERKSYVRGIFRILGIDGREAEMPPTKKREFFIPYPPSTVDSKIFTPKPIPIPQQVINRFVILAKERHDDDPKFPFLPNGYANYQPAAGQLVFFDIQQNQENIEVSEMSFSAIWRKLLDHKSYDFFEKIEPNVLPWNIARENLTPAEYLFGVVEVIKDKKKREGYKQARDLASRVRFHDAQAVNEVQLEAESTLKILSSPKTPCPAMYFHPKGERGQLIKKPELSAERHHPNGRKVYLHHPKAEIEKHSKTRYWETHDSNEQLLKQKMSCQPMRAGQDFYFHIDFDNLKTEELNLLIRSLHPDATFRHRLGLGKSLGLGTVQIEIEGLFLINRLERYSLKGFHDATRYHQVYRGTSNTSETWKDLYPVEFKSLSPTAKNLTDSDFYQTTTLIDTPTLKILQTVGNPANLRKDVPVMPPLLKEQTVAEDETFKWFGANEHVNNPKPQALPAIQAGAYLPVLKRINEPKDEPKNNKPPKTNASAPKPGNHTHWKGR